MGYTNRGKYLEYDYLYRGTTAPTNYYVALVKSTPSATTNLMSDLTEITAISINILWNFHKFWNARHYIIPSCESLLCRIAQTT